MSSPNKKLPESTATNTDNSAIPAEFLLSLVTGPLLLGVISTQAVLSWLQAAGLASEEVFRGDCLPVLHFPEAVIEE
ncbi:hypothetical protein [Lyngbya aestuarii]|uniref:hypothetical protein n=1 Tax=Lyngbya aestuarii TaxID=118322 RepID=UPI00403DA667